MAIGAIIVPDCLSVAPWITNKKKAVSTNSAMKQAAREYWPGECSP